MAKFVQFGGLQVNLDLIQAIGVHPDRDDNDVETGLWAIKMFTTDYTCIERFETKEAAQARSHELAFRAV